MSGKTYGEEAADGMLDNAAGQMAGGVVSACGYLDSAFSGAVE